MKLKTIIAGLFLATAALTAQADSTGDIVNALISKGVLTEEEGALINKGRTSEKEAAEKKAKNTAKVELGNKGLVVKSADGDFSMKLGGRMHSDWTTHNGDDNLVGNKNAVDGTQIRRGRIALSGTVYRDFDYIIETDFAGDKVATKDLFLMYHGFNAPVELTVGHQKHAMSMEIQESSNDIMFTERSLVSSMTTPFFDRAIGVNLKGYGDNWNVQSGVYGDSMAATGSNQNEGKGFGIRGTYAPILEKDRVVHFGANYGIRKTSDDYKANSVAPQFSYRTTNMSGLRLIDTTINDLDSVQTGILEFAAMYGPWSLQSEYALTTAKRQTSSNVDFSGYYVQAGYTLTGESRTYKGSDGEFKRLKPKNNFSLDKGTWGAWEIAGRYDSIDLQDQDVSGGEAKRATVSLNWYLNENVRIMTEYSKTYDLSGGALKKTNGSYADDIDVYTVRTQWAF